jgi:hypothetical protein
MESKFKKGEIVIERIHPTKKLIVADVSNGMYYCKVAGDNKRKPLIYFERDLKTPLQ